MSKRILIIYTSAGAGHLMAARGIEDGLAKYHPNVDFQTIDSLDYTNFFHKKIYADSYLSIVNYVPSFWGYLYNQFDKQKTTKLANRLLSFFDKVNAKKLFDLIREYKPNHIISTHFLPAELLNRDIVYLRARFPGFRGNGMHDHRTVIH